MSCGVKRGKSKERRTTCMTLLAGMDVFARNVPERIMSVIVLGFAVIIFSSVLASAPCLHDGLTGADSAQSRTVFTGCPNPAAILRLPATSIVLLC